MPDDDEAADMWSSALSSAGSGGVPEQAGEATRRATIAATTYEALRSRKRLQSHRILTYRCPERDMLLDVMKFPTGLVFHVPANVASEKTLPPAVSQGRPTPGPWTNDRDVEDRSRSRTLIADQCSSVAVACSHVGSVVLDLGRIRRDMQIGHAEVILGTASG